MCGRFVVDSDEVYAPAVAFSPPLLVEKEVDVKQNGINRSKRGAGAVTCLVARAQSSVTACPARDPKGWRRALGWSVIGLLAWGVSGAWAGDGIVALQTAAASCADNSGDRYVDCGNGTVTDNDTGLVWLKNANCIGEAGGGTGDPTPGRVDWSTAMEIVAGLSDLPGDDPDDCGLEDGSSPGEWRLASQAEWLEMVGEAVALGCSPTLTNDSRTDCWDQNCVDLGACSFTGVQWFFYWSSSSQASLPERAWTVTMDDDIPFNLLKTDSYYLWPVRGGQ